jgi:nicotinamide-nucleotide amidase
MELENKILSRELQARLYSEGKTLGTAESCTGGRIAEAIIAVPGASDYFKGGIVSYTDDVKERLLHVSAETLQAKTAVSEDVAVEMVKGACEALQCTYAIAATGYAGPGGGTAENPVGTIWIAVGNKEKVNTLKLEGDNGRDLNLANATNKALRLFLDYYIEENPKKPDEEGDF